MLVEIQEALCFFLNGFAVANSLNVISGLDVDSFIPDFLFHLYIKAKFHQAGMRRVLCAGRTYRSRFQTPSGSVAVRFRSVSTALLRREYVAVQFLTDAVSSLTSSQLELLCADTETA